MSFDLTNGLHRFYFYFCQQFISMHQRSDEENKSQTHSNGVIITYSLAQFSLMRPWQIQLSCLWFEMQIARNTSGDVCLNIIHQKVDRKGYEYHVLLMEDEKEWKIYVWRSRGGQLLVIKNIFQGKRWSCSLNWSLKTLERC